MALEMKPECQGCAAPLGWQDEALICSYECRWCRPCAEGDGMECSNLWRRTGAASTAGDKTVTKTIGVIDLILPDEL